MKIRFMCPMWGNAGRPIEQFCEEVAAAEYDGVEASVPLDNKPFARRVVSAIKEAGLGWIGQHWETVDSDPDRHVETLSERLLWLAELEPLFINSQTGRDWFSFDQNRRVIDAARSVEAKTGVKIIHETHRGKFSFCAQSTRKFLETYSDLRITADFSHWCTVSESMLEDQADAVSLAIGRADHIHARVGWQEGPQINDPRSPEWADTVAVYLGWWDRIVEAHRQSGEDLTLAPEFGPFPYMPQLPFTRQPVASQWDINLYMMNLLKKRYSKA
jgi:sugar phosphate isomerase/epimerase